MTDTIITPEEQKSMCASQSTSQFRDCLTISHAKIETLYLVCDTKDLVRNGVTFHKASFQVVPPSQDGSTPPKASVTFSIVDRSILIALRQAQGFRPPVAVLCETVDIANPNANVRQFPMQFAGASTRDLQSATVNLTTMQPFLDAQFPLPMFAPSNAAV